MLLEGKSWLTQDYYNEYLELKVNISTLTDKLNHQHGRVTPLTEEQIQEIQSSLNQKVKRMKLVLEQLKLGGISHVDLILLSLGVQVE